MLISWLARRRDYQTLVDAEATRLVEREGRAGYYTAKAIKRMAVGSGDKAAARFWVRVARQVAARTGLLPGHSKIGRPESDW
jgi:hypothetical protein